LTLPEGRFPVGSPILEIHLGNEQVPPFPRAGPDRTWASQAAHQLRSPFRALAAYVTADEARRVDRLFGGTTVLVDGPASQLLPRRLGFQLRPHASSRGRLLEAWQNLYALRLLAAFNPLSVRNRSTGTLRRIDLWMPMDSFLRCNSLTPGPSPAERERDRG
jgi:hypothetical protein